MKRAIFSIVTVVVLVGVTGCIHNGRRPWHCMGGSCAQAPENGQACHGQVCADPNDPDQGAPCQACGGRGCRLCRDKCRGQACVDSGPATGAVTYPYYTTRGPRDFLQKNPQSIGP
ncbi:MAG: hypothetical protein ABFC96_08925 [Thermoguttaceae bacterium]